MIVGILFIVYSIAGYWAVGKVIYANKVVIYSGTYFYAKKIVLGLCLGWILIPIAIIKTIMNR